MQFPENERLGRVLYTAEQLQERVRAMGEQITHDYAGTSPLIVGVLKGSVIFLSDLIRHIELPLQIDFMSTSSYGNSTKSSGVVRIMQDIQSTLKDRHVIIVEDIVDTGLTLNYLLQVLSLREPASLKICSLLDKPSRRLAEVPVEYLGFSIPDLFVIGYGLDYANRYRNLPYIGTLELDGAEA
jgi:hypoxanthine phosphoribosyltransferase